MTAKVFLDTNILVYAAVGTGRDERKRKRALALIESEDFGTSAQVLQEFFVTVVKKASRPLSASPTGMRRFWPRPRLSELGPSTPKTSTTGSNTGEFEW